MRPWASWTTKTALLAAGFAAAGGGLSGVALAGDGGSSTSGHAPVLSGDQLIAPVAAVLPAAGAAQTPASDPGSGNVAGSGNVSAGGGNTVSLPVSLPVDVCGNAAAVLGDSTAGCAGGALAGPATHQAAGDNADAITGEVIQSALAPVTSALGATGPGPLGAAGPLGTTGPLSAGPLSAGPLSATGPLDATGPLSELAPLSGLAPVSAVAGSGPATPGILGVGGTAAPAPGSGRTFDSTPGAGAGVGDTNVPAASQLAGLGALPGLADLPSLAGLANMPALNGVTGSGIPMPGTALSAADIPGMSSDSFAALAVGALLAGASALKIAGRRTRDRRAGIGVVTI